MTKSSEYILTDVSDHPKLFIYCVKSSYRSRVSNKGQTGIWKFTHWYTVHAAGVLDEEVLDEQHVYILLGTFECWNQCCRFSRNIAQVTLINIYFYYRKYINRMKVSKYNNEILKKTSLIGTLADVHTEWQKCFKFQQNI